MHSQQLLALGGLVLAGNVAIAAKLEHDDVPSRCWAACGPVVGISEQCDHQHDNDSAELKCICDWSPAKTQIPLCAACITQYGNNHNGNDHDHDDDDDNDDDGNDIDNDNDNDNDDDDDDDNEALDIVRWCKFCTTTYDAAAATTLSTTATATDSGSNAATTTSGSSSTGSGSTSSSDLSSSDSTASGSSASSTPTTDAAASISVPGAAALAIAGLMPLAWL